YPLEDTLESLGEINIWQAEWKWDGIRCQLIRRGAQTFLWSRGEELVTERYPELAAVGDALPEGTAIDGEILPFKDDKILPFAMLQKRIGRKAVTRSILAQVPVIIMAYDLIEHAGADIRLWPLDRRREALAAVIAGLQRELPMLAPRLRLSPLVDAASWDELARADRQPRAGSGGPDDQAAGRGLWRGPAPGRLVEVESAAQHNRRRAPARPARQWQAS